MKPNKLPTCLIVPHYVEALISFMNVVHQVKKMGIRPLVLASDDASVTLCETHHIPVYRLPNLPRHIRTPFGFFYYPQLLRRYCRRLLHLENVVSLLLVDDRRFVEIYLVEVAHKLGIPSFVLMWASTNSKDNMIRWRQKTKRISSESYWHLLKPVIQKIAPQAIADKDVYWQHPLDILSLALFAKYPPHPWVLGGGGADIVMVAGEYYRNLLIEGGVPVSKIVITGHPRHDDLVNLRDQWETRITPHPYILLAAPPLEQIKNGVRSGHVTLDQMNSYLDKVIACLRTFPYEIVVKSHPRDIDAELPYMQHHTDSVLLVRDQAIAPLLANAAMVVCQGSSVAFDACGLNIPILTFDFHNTPGYDIWGEAGIALHVTDIEQLSSAIETITTDTQVIARLQEARNNFVRHYMVLDGKATERITKQLIANVIGMENKI